MSEGTSSKKIVTFPAPQRETGERLDSWKEIAAYLKRDVRTVIRWEKTEGLPVRRQMHQARGSVFAYPSELEAWKTSRELRLDKDGVTRLRFVDGRLNDTRIARKHAMDSGVGRGSQHERGNAGRRANVT